MVCLLVSMTCGVDEVKPFATQWYKTKLLWCAHPRRLHQLENKPLRIGCDTVQPVQQVRDLGIFIDGELAMTVHVSKTVACCFAALWQIRSIQRSVSRSVLLSVVTSLELSLLDYGSATLAGIPKYLLDRLQSILNAAARLIDQAHKYDHVSPFLQELHWLSVPERIKYRLTALVFRCWYDIAPEYMVRDLQWAAYRDSQQRLCSSSSQQLIAPRTRLFTVGDRAFGAAAARIWNSLPPTVIPLQHSIV